MSVSALLTASLIVSPPPAPPVPDRVRESIVASIPKLLGMQEAYEEDGDGDRADGAAAVKAEWPYQGVYRVRGRIPYGYRVGGTAIVAQALLEAPGYGDDPARQEAIALACDFVCAAIDEPLMSADPEVYVGGYDVRGWGHCYGLRFLLALERRAAIPAGRADAVDRSIGFYLHALESTEIPTSGGWNYARARRLETPSPSSPFMTAPAVLALLEAKRSGRAIDEAVLERAIAALERSRTHGGYVEYSVMGPPRDRPDQIPGAIGRMVATESALFLCGRSNCDRLSFAVERFVEHWDALERRRQKSGTHEPPYGVAPYYFFYGFNHAALAVGLLPPSMRDTYRSRLTDILFDVRDDDGLWNDRVFTRSRSYGTAMTIGAFGLLWEPTGPASPEEPAPGAGDDA